MPHRPAMLISVNKCLINKNNNSWSASVSACNDCNLTAQWSFVRNSQISYFWCILKSLNHAQSPKDTLTQTPWRGQRRKQVRYCQIIHPLVLKSAPLCTIIAQIHLTTLFSPNHMVLSYICS